MRKTEPVTASGGIDLAPSNSPAPRETSRKSGSDADAAGSPVTAVSGTTLRDLLTSGLAWLERHHEIVNALNVFPVPDGDTGTNMLLTMRSACQEVNSENTLSVGDVARAAAHGAL